MAPQELPGKSGSRPKKLYVVDGCTFEQVAEATGVSVSQLKRWSAEEKEWEAKQSSDRENLSDGNSPEGKDWPEARKEFRLALAVIRRDSVLLRAKLIRRLPWATPNLKRFWPRASGKDPGT